MKIHCIPKNLRSGLHWTLSSGRTTLRTGRKFYDLSIRYRNSNWELIICVRSFIKSKNVHTKSTQARIFKLNESGPRWACSMNLVDPSLKDKNDQFHLYWILDRSKMAKFLHLNAIHVKDRHCLSQKRSVAKTTTSSRLESCARNLFNGSDAGIKFFWLANFLDWLKTSESSSSNWYWRMLWTLSRGQQRVSPIYFSLKIRPSVSVLSEAPSIFQEQI